MPMTPERFLVAEVIPALAWLSGKCGRDMGPPEVLVQLLTAALHESDGLKARVQYGPGGSSITKRPAHGRWMFEGGKSAALAGLWANPTTAPLLKAACGWLDVEPLHDHAWWALVGNDKLAAICARLLLLTDPHPMPMIDDVAESYACYLRLWRPGKEPGLDKWREVHQRAAAAVASAYPYPERYEDKPVATTTSSNPDLAAILARMDQLTAMAQPAALNATIGAGVTEKQLAAIRARSLVVSPPSSGNQVIVDPPQGQSTWSRGSTAFAVLGALPMISQLGMQLYDPLVAAAHSNDWLSVAGIALTGLTLASQRWADRGSFDAAARVATAAVDPVGALPTPIAMPAPAAPLPELGQLSEADLNRLAALLKAQGVPANAA